ncbi:MAG: imidazoleglycerol-phosphate dehydratase HisB [Firmicutes bacterium]|nr:imidazoleglycerol-phosphate dehydratase HisB [Bacillota bacterium]
MTRSADVERTTQETSVRVHLELDAQAPPHIETNLPLLTHFVSALAVHGRFSVDLAAHGDVEVDAHHLVEDVGIALGSAFREALGDRRGIQRFGQRLMPMDEALVLCAVDISGRGQCFWSGDFPVRAIGTVSGEVWPEFFHGFARHAGMTVHLSYLFGQNAHHVYEAAFKGLGQALHEACQVRHDLLPSTKGVLE